MTLIETLTVGLGTAILKAATKVWLKDSDVAAGAATASIDIVKKRFDDFETQRATTRLLDGLQDDVARCLAETIDAEFREVPSEERVAAALAVKDVLDAIDLSAEVVRQDLNPLHLIAVASDSANSRFAALSDGGSRLAQLILSESCTYVVSIAQRLPNFQLAASRELLRRSTTLQSDLANVLDGIAKIRTEAGGRRTQEIASFETRYRRTVADKLDRLQLFGLDSILGPQSYALSVAYVTLRSTSESDPLPGDVDERLPSMTRIVIRGEAGSGKTTLMQWLAVRASRSDFSGRLKAWNNRLPFYIRLRDYASEKLPTPELLINSVAQNLSSLMPTDWTIKTLERGALVLIDGADEIPVTRRDELTDWLEDLTRDFRESIFLLSSRPAALDSHRPPLASASQRLKQLGFGSLVIEPMSVRDIDALVAHWHTAARRDLVSDEDSERLVQYDQALRKLLRDQPSLQGLASNPLMCAMICALNWHTNQAMPSQRMDLYRLAIEVLAHRRDASRRVLSPNSLSLEPRTREDILDSVAYWMLRNGYSDAAIDEVEERVPRVLKYLGLVSASATARDVLSELLERSGILTQPEHGVIGFLHRTFLEFMAARAAVAQGDMGVLVGQAQDEGWREPIVFAAGHAQGLVRDRFIGSLLKRRWLRIPSRGIEADITAICCIETAGANLDPRLLLRLFECAKAIFPPKDFEDARLLAPAAKACPNLLVGFSESSEGIIAACVRCAALAGGPAMIDVIAGYASGARPLVIEELLKAWTTFDSDAYIERVVKRSPLYAVLRADSGTVDADKLRCLQVLNYREEYLGDPAALAAAVDRFSATKAIGLGIAVEGVSSAGSSLQFLAPLVTAADLRQVASLKTLRDLALGDFEVGALAALAALPDLRSLSVPHLDSADIPALERMLSLRELILGKTRRRSLRPRRSDLSYLVRCPQIKRLCLWYFNDPSDVGHLNVSMTHIEDLELKWSAIQILPGIERSDRLHTVHRTLRSLSIENDSLAGATLSLARLGALTTLHVALGSGAARMELPPSLCTLSLQGTAEFAPLDLDPTSQLTEVSLSDATFTPELARVLAFSRLRRLSLSGISDPSLLSAAESAQQRGVSVSIA